MDHTYDFHIALAYLQLNEFEKAEQVFTADHKTILAHRGEDWLHPVDLFYYGISKFELEKFHEAIDIFDMSLKLYPEFSDVQYYKALCLAEIDSIDAAKALMQLAELNGRKGYSIPEDNVIYEQYPYQIRWH